MKKNIGIKDRLLRLTIGIICLLLAWLQSSWFLLIWGVIAVCEALASWCFIYQLIGKNTCPISQHRNDDDIKK